MAEYQQRRVGPDRAIALAGAAGPIKATNLGPSRVYIGGPAVTPDTGWPLLPGETESIDLDEIPYAIAPRFSPTPGNTIVALISEGFDA